MAKMEGSLVISYKAKYSLIMQSRTHALRYLHKKLYLHKNCTWMFIAALFVTTKN